jgi:VanZ family protein
VSEPAATAPAASPWPRRLAWLLPALAWAALIFWVSSQSNPFPRLTLRVSDKILHAIEYGALGVAVTWGLHRAWLALASAAAWAVVVGSAYGLTDEIHQAFVPHRSAELGDWAADTVGAALGALLAYAGLRWWRSRANLRA